MQWRRRYRCYRIRGCKKADTPEDGVANVADVTVVAPVNADIAVAAALGCCIGAAKNGNQPLRCVAVNMLALQGDAE